jgi:glycosyltransferase involved in cell wall biosynthesis
MPLSLPLVSIIVINFNYGRYLVHSVGSALSQTYKNIEIIIVDDASNDSSLDVIAGLKADYPHICTVLLAKNRGQSGAAQAAFAKSSGDYIILLDADDELLPTCVETFVYAFLSLRRPVGAISADVLQAVDGNAVSVSTHGFSEAVASKNYVNANLFRPIDKACPGLPWTTAEAFVEVDELHFLGPEHSGAWPWSPTSANCFRRTAFALMMEDAEVDHMRWGTDAYLLRGVSALTGTVLLDRPLAIYRIHGGNTFATHPYMHNFLSFDSLSDSSDCSIMAKSAIDRILDKIDVIGGKLISPWRLIGGLKAINSTWPGLKADDGTSYLASKLLKRHDRLVKVLGPATVNQWFLSLLSQGGFINGFTLMWRLLLVKLSSKK